MFIMPGHKIPLRILNKKDEVKHEFSLHTFIDIQSLDCKIRKVGKLRLLEIIKPMSETDKIAICEDIFRNKNPFFIELNTLTHVIYKNAPKRLINMPFRCCCICGITIISKKDTISPSVNFEYTSCSENFDIQLEKINDCSHKINIFNLDTQYMQCINKMHMNIQNIPDDLEFDIIFDCADYNAELRRQLTSTFQYNHNAYIPIKNGKCSYYDSGIISFGKIFCDDNVPVTKKKYNKLKNRVKELEKQIELLKK